MSNPDSNPYLRNVLNRQNAIIASLQQECIEKFGRNVLESFPISSENRSHCPPSWDGITCWDETLAGTIATKKCSALSYVEGFALENNASKHCLQTGMWLMENNAYWTNFTQCHAQNETTVITKHNLKNASALLREYFPLLKGIKETGYLISLITLIVALLIMVTIKKLHCARNILHIHLFTSFILRAFIFLLKEVIFVDGLGLRSDILGNRNGTFFYVDTKTNNWQCKLLTSLWQYFTMANYSWILMEGLYLYNLIFRALFADSSGSILWYIIMGWGFPFLVVIPWILGRIFKEDTLCWTERRSKLYLIIDLSTLLSVLINLVFFMRISLVLLNKLRSPLNDDNRRCYMKWAKSTLVLVPLFGVNYMMFLGLKLIKNEIVELIWFACDSLFGSFQGFFVAVLYCFLNGEVKSEMKPFICGILPFFATNRVFRVCFPCREKFLRSTRGRISVCTTLSCSSMYANGLMNARNNVTKKRDSHHCHNLKRMSQEAITCDSARTSINLSYSRKQSLSHKIPNNEDVMEMSNLFHPEIKPSTEEEYSSLVPQQC